MMKLWKERLLLVEDFNHLEIPANDNHPYYHNLILVVYYNIQWKYTKVFLTIMLSFLFTTD